MGTTTTCTKRVLAVAVSLTTLMLAGVIGGAASEAQTSGNIWLTERRFLNLAHGGGLHEAPQGTLYAYKTALARGANALEMDLHITLDGQVVAIHDSTVDRTTDGSGCVVAHTLAELKALDAAHTFVPGRGPTASADPGDYPWRGVATGDVAPPAGFTANDFTIATLEEIFQAEPDALKLMELKPTEIYQSHDCPGFVGSLAPADRPDLEAEVARLIDVYDMADTVMVASFVDDMLHRFKGLAPEVDTSFPVNESIAVYLAFLAGDPLPNPWGHKAFQLPLNFSGIAITEELVQYAQAHGVAVHFWTINDLDTMRMLIDWGADGLITDRPQVLAQLMDEVWPPTDPPPSTPSPSTPPTEVTTSTTEPAPSTTEPAPPEDPEPDGPGPAPDGGTGTAPGTADPDTGRPEADRPAPPSATGLVRTGISVAPLVVGVALIILGGLVLSLRRLNMSRMINNR